MAKSVQFPVALPRDFETLIRYEGRDIRPLPSVGFTDTVGNPEVGTQTLSYENWIVGKDTSYKYTVPVGKCLWVETITWGAMDNNSGLFTFNVLPYSQDGTDVWGLGSSTGDADPTALSTVANELYTQFGSNGSIRVNKWFREHTVLEAIFTPYQTGYKNFAFSIQGVEFTGNAGLNFGANKSMLLCGASTSWYLIGDWRNNVDSYKNVPSGSTVGSVEAVTYMLPDQSNSAVSEPPFSGDGLWGNQLIYDFMENGKDWRWVNKSFGGSNFTKNWYGAIQSGYLNGVKTDLLMVEAGVNDTNLAPWTSTLRTQFKDRLAKFTEWRNRWNPDAPVVYISPALLDTGFGVNLDTGSGYLTSPSPSDIGYFLDPRTAVASTAPSGSNFDTRCTWDSGSNGEYVSGSTTYYMTRIEIARQLVKEVATSASYGGGTANNVYYIDGLQSDWEHNTIWRQETQDGSSSVDYTQQQGLRFAKYYRLEDIEAGQSGSTSHQAKADGYLPAGKAIVGEIEYFASASGTGGEDSMSPYNYTTGGSTLTVTSKDTEDLIFRNPVEQNSGARLHRSPMGMYNHYQNIKDKLVELGLYDTF